MPAFFYYPIDYKIFWICIVIISFWLYFSYSNYITSNLREKFFHGFITVTSWSFTNYGLLFNIFGERPEQIIHSGLDIFLYCTFIIFFNVTNCFYIKILVKPFSFRRFRNKLLDQFQFNLLNFFYFSTLPFLFLNVIEDCLYYIFTIVFWYGIVPILIFLIFTKNNLKILEKYQFVTCIIWRVCLFFSWSNPSYFNYTFSWLSCLFIMVIFIFLFLISFEAILEACENPESIKITLIDLTLRGFALVMLSLWVLFFINRTYFILYMNFDNILFFLC